MATASLASAHCTRHRLDASKGVLPAAAEWLFAHACDPAAADRTADLAEVMVIFKTTGPAYAPLEKRLRKLHPYKNPEIVAIEAGAASQPYAAWVAAATQVS